MFFNPLYVAHKFSKGQRILHIVTNSTTWNTILQNISLIIVHSVDAIKPSGET
jgi:hypothetical protein